VEWSSSTSSVGIDNYELHVDSAVYTTSDTMYNVLLTTEGSNSIYVRCIDKIGNESYSDTVTIGVSGIEENGEREGEVEIRKTIRGVYFINRSKELKEYRIIDITGREVDRIMLLPKRELYYSRKSGVYYIMNEEKAIEEKIIMIK